MKFTITATSPFTQQNRMALGKCGYYALTCLINDVAIDSIRLRAPLVVRGSTGPAPQREDGGHAQTEEEVPV